MVRNNHLEKTTKTKSFTKKRAIISIILLSISVVFGAIALMRTTHFMAQRQPVHDKIGEESDKNPQNLCPCEEAYNAEKEKSVVHLSGTVKISITEGSFECDLAMTNIPNIRDYFIRLNRGMENVQFRNKKDNNSVLSHSSSSVDSLTPGPTSAYFFPDKEGKCKFLPEELQVSYAGKFPVVVDSTQAASRGDYKGQIAFNGYSVRTDGFQTAWYPYLYDLENDVRHDAVTYDIELICKDCSTLYINGSKPIRASSANFKSQNPYSLALFSGKFDFADDGNVIILNPQHGRNDIQQFSKLISSYIKYYEQKLNIPFGTSPVFVNTTPISLNVAWLYVSFPTIFGITGREAYFGKVRNGLEPFIAHELGHYYFGTLRAFNSPLGDMLSEGFAEYISLKLTEDLVGIEQYNAKVINITDNLRSYKTKPLSLIKGKSDIGNRDIFVYNCAPAIFLAIEKEIGKNNMWKWIKALLETEANFTNYEFMTSTLINTLNDSEKFRSVESAYFTSENAVGNALAKLNFDVISLGGKPDDVQVKVSRAEASEAEMEGRNESIEKTIDGNLSTRYHSRWYDGTRFPVTLTYYFEDVDRIDYLVYHPQRENANGRFIEFELWSSTGEGQPEFAKIGNYNFKGVGTPSKVSFPGGLKKPKALRFVVKSGTGYEDKSFVGCAEMCFFRNK